MDAALRAAADAHAVLGVAGYIPYRDVVQRAGFRRRTARDGGELDSFAAAPPRVRVETRRKGDVAVVDVVYVALIAKLDAKPARAGLDLAAVSYTHLRAHE